MNNGLFYTIFLLGFYFCEASVPDIILPGIKANKPCKGKDFLGRCVPRSQCGKNNRNNLICDHYDGEVFVCCQEKIDVNSKISRSPLKESKFLNV